MMAKSLMNRGYSILATRIDDMYFSMIDKQLQESLNQLSEIRLPFSSFKPEIETLFLTIYYSFSIGQSCATPGMKILDLDVFTKKIPKYFLHRRYVLIMLLIWMYKRLKHVSIIEGWRIAEEGSQKKSLWKILQLIEFLFKFSNVSNTISFLLHGKYPNLLHRLMNYVMVLIIFSINPHIF